MHFFLSLLVVATTMAVAVSAAGPRAYVETAYSHTLTTALRDASLDVFHDKFSSVALPDVAGRASAFIGSVDYALRSLLLQSVALNNAQLVFLPPSRIVVKSVDLAAAASFHWSYREVAWPHASDGGSGTARVSRTSVELTIELSKAEDGRPTVAVADANVVVGELDISLSGGASWLYKFVLGAFKAHAVDSLQSALRDAVVDAFTEQASAFVAALPLRLDLGAKTGLPVGTVDLSLVAAPVVDDAFVRSSHLGRIVDPADPAHAYEPTVEVGPLPALDSGRDVQMAVSAGLLNSDFSYMYATKALNTQLVALPASSPIQLLVSNFRQMVPALAKYFKDSQQMLAVVTLDAPPNITLSASRGVLLEAHASIAFSVYPDGIVVTDPATAPAAAFAYELGAVFKASASFALAPASAPPSHTLLVGSVAGLDVDLSARRSAIGPVDATTTSQFANFALHRVLVPQLNGYLSTGYPLPLAAGIDLVDPELTTLDGAFLINSGVKISAALLESLLE
ncbi:uncharacterized protein AMSG_02724 [Thecamonas trahens ATCC 50062]|uniref:Lipid-binding serum glycoprotein C-terminal domain-containing protein n=1 Tax=Thecamonas trahens ATCC 50062 TaxID=461836 RepID=A0A0L0D239_THETB|nr:hypothetical protein AMSG_02724 [Thecamonas trahens ATCC 50062]KNC46271.1 hypothetical protein AMSG_02724 [Thecamonas trahens ATCC 50062]|eukprot:XP_013760565.1 hypothetical protein AMSG_02724 [Thecamonas trahens ATCC 50062]